MCQACPTPVTTARGKNESRHGAARAARKEYRGLLRRIVLKRKPRVRNATIRTGSIEVIKRGASRYDFHDPYHIALQMSWKGFALTFVGLELCINLFFALLYFASPGCVANARPGAFSDVFFFSIETLATVGYGAMAPATLYGHAVSAADIISGMAFTAIIAEGHAFRHVHDLALSNATLPLFALTWTLMHRIDEQSPLAGYDAERYAEKDVRLFLTIEARDHALGAAVHDMRIY